MSIRPNPAKPTVRVDVDALAAWRGDLPQTRLASLRRAARVEFDHCEGVSGTPPEPHEFMAQIWCCDANFGLRVPLRVLTFEERK